MERSNCIGNCHLNMLSCLFCSFCGTLKIARVVAGIKNAENIDSVFCGSFNKLVNNIICVVAVSQKILSAQKHHNLIIWKSSMKLAKTLPRIFIQKADTRVISCSAPAFNSPVADFINHSASRKHISSCHACGMQRLMGITQNKFRNSNFLRHKSTSYKNLLITKLFYLLKQRQ